MKLGFILAFATLSLLAGEEKPRQEPVKMAVVSVGEDLKGERSSGWIANQAVNLSLDPESDWGLAPSGFAGAVKNCLESWPKKGEAARLVVTVQEWKDGKGIKRLLTVGDLSAATIEAKILKGNEVLGILQGKIPYRSADVKDFSASPEKIIAEKLYRALLMLQKGN